MKYIVGLGNPGAKYEYTRHNVGALVLDAIRREFEMERWEKDNMRNAFVSKGKIKENEATLVLPQTFMNLSGESVKDLSGENAKDLIVIHDDIDLPFGTLRISKDRGTGGHNGVESIISHIKTKDFVRIRIGVTPVYEGEMRKPKTEEEIEKFVLGNLNEKERQAIVGLSKKVSEALVLILESGVEEAMNIYNQKSSL